MTGIFDVTVVGTGNWGTTLALVLCRGGRQVALLARTAAEAAQLRADNENQRYLPGFSFPPTLTITADKAVVRTSRLVLLAVPSKTMHTNIEHLAAHIEPECVVLSCAKGFEPTTLERMSRVIQRAVPQLDHGRIGTLSGPNIAREIAQGLPAATVVATADEAVVTEAQTLLTTNLLRVYRSNDVVGVELAGALKNIIALGAGIADGMGIGDNAKAAFMTRGISEMTRLGVALGANVLTFAGLAGLGDLLATCASPHSRNRRLGEALAQGIALEEAQRTLGQVAEGVGTTQTACALAERYGVEMPITNEMYQVLYAGKSAQQAGMDLMQRDPKDELAGLKLLGERRSS